MRQDSTAREAENERRERNRRARYAVIQTNLPHDLAGRLDRYRAEVAARFTGEELSRSAAIRALVRAGLDEFDRRKADRARAR